MPELIHLWCGRSSSGFHVLVNDEDVRYLGSPETPITDGDTVSIQPAVAGA